MGTAGNIGGFASGFMQGLNPFIEMSIKQKIQKQQQDMQNEAAQKQLELQTQKALQIKAAEMAMGGQAQLMPSTIRAGAGNVPMSQVQQAEPLLGNLPSPNLNPRLVSNDLRLGGFPTAPMGTQNMLDSQLPAYQDMSNPETPNFTISPEMANTSGGLVKPGGYRLGQQAGLYSAEEVPVIAKQYFDKGMDVAFEPSKTTPGKYQLKDVKMKTPDPLLGLQTEKLKQDIATGNNKLVETKQVEEKARAAAISSIQDTLDTIKEVKAGQEYFGVTGKIPSLPGTKGYKWDVNVNKLLAGKVLDTINTMKSASKTGATGFGAMNAKEGQWVESASSRLNKGLSESDAMEILNGMEIILNKALQQQSGGGDQFQMGQTMQKDGKTYKYLGNGQWEY